MKPPEGMHQLMRIEEHKRLEDDQLQSKGKALATQQYRKDSHPRGYQQRHEPKGVNVAFKELVHLILERIKHEPCFCWPSKMGREPTKRNWSLYCMYHCDKGHTT